VPDEDHVSWDVTAGFGVSAPVAYGDLLVALVEPETVVALDRATGAERWRKELSVFDLIDGADAAAGKKAMATTVDYWRRGIGQKSKRKDVDLGPAKAAWKILSHNNVPIISADRYKYFGYTWGDPDSDGERIYVKFTSGSIAALKGDGSVAWRRRGYVGDKAPTGAAPALLAGDRYIYKDVPTASELPADIDKQEHHKYVILVALDAATGEPRWRSPPFVKADHGEWGGLALATVDGKPVVITTGGEAFAATDGKHLGSQLGHCGWGPGPSGGPDVVAFGNAVTPLSLVDGRIPAPKEPGGSKLTQGTVCKDRVYAWSRGQLWIKDLAGKELWRGSLQLGRQPVDKQDRKRHPFNGPGGIVGDYFIAAGDPETVAVVHLAGDRPRVVARNPMGGPIKAPPVGVGTRLFFRIGERIVAIE
jgi:hypothetical protein